MTRWASGVLLALVAVVPAMPLAAQQAGGLDELAWLEGEWERTTRSGVAVERWEVTDAGLVGEGLAERGGEQRVTEALLLVEMDGEVFYVAKPPQNPFPTPFRLVSSDNGVWVFENPTHDFPQRIIYERMGDDRMTATIEGPGNGGRTQQIVFEFTRR